MTLQSLLDDLAVFCIFLMIGFLLREFIKPLRKLFLPASIIGGAVALILGNQCIGLVQIPDSFEGVSGVLITVVTTSVVFGIDINLERLKSDIDYTLACNVMYGYQLLVGTLVGAALCLIWPALPEGWGIMGVFAYFGGHGTALVAADAFEQLGIEGTREIAVILATIGLITAMVLGMVVVNFGIRKGWGSYVQSPDKSDEATKAGVLPKEKQVPIGMEKVNSIGINSLALQLCFIMISIFIGTVIFGLLDDYIAIVSQFPGTIKGIVGAIILWPLLKKLKLDGYVDRRSISTISGLALELVVLTAVATLRIDIITSYFWPIMIYSAAIVLPMLIICVALCRGFCGKENWFEKACCLFDMSNGNNATGLALLRAVDPNSQSNVAEALGVFMTVSLWIQVAPGLFPMMVTGSMWTMVLIGVGLVVVDLVVMKLFFAAKRGKQ